MKDGLYQVTTSYLCAGFVIKDDIVIECAPILYKKIEYWKSIAIWIAPLEETNNLLQFAQEPK